MLFSQSNNGDTIKFEMIKSTVNFYSTDRKAYSNLNGKLLNCSPLNYQCIYTYCIDNNVESILGKVNKWKGKPSTTAVFVKILKNEIITDLTSPDRNSYRKSLPSFSSLIQKLDSLENSFLIKTDVLPPQVNTVTIPPTQIDTSEIGSGQKPEPPTNENKIPIIAMILSIVALFSSIYSIFKKNTKSTSTDESVKTDENKYLVEEIRVLKSQLIKKPNIDISQFESKISAMEAKISQLENQIRIFELASKDEKTQKPAPEVSRPNTTPKASYAKLPDLGNGFSQSIISENQNGEQIYEFKFNGERGSFSITNDTNAQKYALNDVNYYLNNACDSINQPFKGARIVTKVDGTIIKSGGNWIIQTKAKIEFK